MEVATVMFENFSEKTETEQQIISTYVGTDYINLYSYNIIN